MTFTAINKNSLRQILKHHHHKSKTRKEQYIHSKTPHLVMLPLYDDKFPTPASRLPTITAVPRIFHSDLWPLPLSVTVGALNC